MGQFKIREEDVFFILKDQLDYGSICQLEPFLDFDEDTLDLMGRKMQINDGAPYRAYMRELSDFCSRHVHHPTLGPAVRRLAAVVRRMAEVTSEMSERRTQDALQWASYTYPALMCYGDVTATWRLLDMAVIAQEKIDREEGNDFYLGKVKQATFFEGVTMPETFARLDTCVRPEREVVEIPEGAF